MSRPERIPGPSIAARTPSDRQERPENLFDRSFEELAGILAGFDPRPFRADQLLRWVYARGARRFEEMTDMPEGLRRSLALRLELSPLTLLDAVTSADGTVKSLYRLSDGELIESVLMPEDGHASLCLSTQAGCAMGCVFCETARLGLRRNLTRGEMLGQVAEAVRGLGERRLLRNLVFMGMGEPLANLDEVIPALRMILDGRGFDFSPRHVTVSTCGLVPGLARLGAEGGGVNVAVSLNAADDETRSRLMPVNRSYPLAALVRELRSYPLRPRQRITVEYVLVDGVNDAPADAANLAELLDRIPCKVNLIPCNPNSKGFAPPSEERQRAFAEVLLGRGRFASVRKSRGSEIGAACGQLRAAALPAT